MALRKVLFITAANRPNYFREVLSSWRDVRGFYDWNVVIRLEPTDKTSEMLETVAELEHSKLQTIVNPEVYGVLHHPWVGFNEIFNGFTDFVVRAEDDLTVSSDILEFFDWAAEAYRADPEIATVLGYTERAGAEDLVVRQQDFSPWVWGTWQDRWENVIRDTWDHTYSTFNAYPGNQAGWDWNLNTRVLPSLGLKNIAPASSRVQNIGVWGIHGTEGNFVQSPSFVSERPQITYIER